MAEAVGWYRGRPIIALRPREEELRYTRLHYRYFRYVRFVLRHYPQARLGTLPILGPGIRMAFAANKQVA
jgi:hypothetical protein